MKIEAVLDKFEAEALFSILHDEIIKHRIESKLQFSSGEIDMNRFDWHQKHADFLEKIKEKLLMIN